MKRLVTLILALVMIISLVACGAKEENVAAPEATDAAPAATDAAPAEAEQVTITWGVYETDNLTSALWDSIIAAFEAENPNINVEKVVATSDRGSFWMAAAASGTFPDVLVEAHSFAKTEPDLFADVPADVQEIFDPAALVTNGGTVRTIPNAKQLRMQCYYNKADYAELNLSEPTTYDEFVANCAALKAAGKTPLICGGTGDSWATGEPWWISVSNQSILNTYPDINAKLLSGDVKFTDPVFEKSMNDWYALIEAGYYHPGCMSWSYAQAAAEFQNGAASMMIDGSWAAASFDAAGSEDFGVFVVPNPDGANGYCAPFQYWGVSSQSKNPEAAWTFVKWFFTNDEAYSTYLQADGLFSVTKEPVTYEQGPLMTKFVENQNALTLYPEFIIAAGDAGLPGEVQTELDKAMQLIFTGTPASDALAMVQDAFEIMIAE